MLKGSCLPDPDVGLERVLERGAQVQVLGDQFVVEQQINDQWRICFAWRDGEAWDVEIDDYH